ncbi:MAG: alginate export family protein, partial [Archangium sp.]|nr:alginate export family protein [Archangium sp.]
MSPSLSLCLLLLAQPAEDAGTRLEAATVESAATPDAGPPVAVAPVPALVSFDVANTPWGPGRKSSGELFRSAALALPEAPLRWSWNGFSLALGGQYLARGEVRDNVDFSTATQDQALGIEHRARVSLRASAKDRVGVLIELQDVRGWGSEPNTVTTTPNTGLHQGFVDVHAADWLDVRVGRQELSYGEDRLIGSLDWAMSARAFDGVFVRLTPSSAVTVDAFGMMLKPPAWLTDANGLRFHNSGSYFAGLVTRVRAGKAGVDVSALGLFEDPATATTGLGKDNNRVTLGARGFFNVASLAVVGEGAFQTGKVGPREDLLVAGAFAAKATWTFSGVWGSPYVLAEFSMASPTFSQLFPTGH